MKKILLFIQSLLTIAIVVLSIMCFLGNNGLIKVVQIMVAADLIVIGICNAVMNKEKKYTIIYLAVGVLMLIVGILGILGVA